MKKWIGLLLSLVFLFNAVFALADPEDSRTPVTLVIATSSDIDSIPVYGGPMDPPQITSDDGIAVFSIPQYSMYSYDWEKYTDGEWAPASGSVFSDGVYRFACQVRIDGEYGLTYRLAPTLKVKINNIEWTVAGGGENPVVGDTFSYEYICSPSYTIVEPPAAPLAFDDDPDYDIPLSHVGTAITSFSVAGSAMGGKQPYTFSKTSGPAWITVSSAGEISGTPTTPGANETLVVRVTDSEANYEEIEIAVGTTAVDPASRTDVTSVIATSDIADIPAFGAEMACPVITSSDGIATFTTSGNSSTSWAWAKKNGTEWEDVSGTFSEGTYRFSCQIRIDGENGLVYKLAAPLTVKVDGVSWIVSGGGSAPSVYDTFSYDWVTSQEFTIVNETPQIDISAATVTGIEDQVYTAHPLTPVPVVTLGGVTLTKDVDYTVSYSNNTNIGTATVVITGIGSYAGSITLTFQILSPAATTPAPTTPAPTTPTPVTPAPTTPAPITPAPTTPTPITPAPTTPTPITPAPTTPAPITPAPTTPAPITPAPTTPAPTTPTPIEPEPEEITATGGVYLVNYTAKTATFLRAAKKNTAKLRILGSVTVKKKLYPVTAVADNACKGMSKLTEVFVGANVKAIGKNAFASCPKLKTVKGCANVVSIGDSAFDGCKSLTALATFQKATKIGAAAFRGTGLKKLTLGVKLKTVGKNAFANCASLAKIEGGKSLITIQAGAFSGCVKLTKVPNLAKLQTIGDSAFKDCKALPKITLCAKVKNIGKNAFQGCQKLQNITLQTKLLTDKTVGANAFKGIHSKPTVRCPKGMANKYKKLLLKKGMPKKAIFK